MENSLKNIAKAIVAVQQEVKGIEKNLSVGSGNYGYKGVADKDVKKVVGEAMAKNGLSMLPIQVTPTVNVDTWEEKDYKGNLKRKKEVFTQVETKYLLLHTSGESIELAGYGQGVDNQDKGAGKATTYAEKYTILYAFLIPTGNIDDSDNTHSNEYDTDGNVVKSKATEKVVEPKATTSTATTKKATNATTKKATKETTKKDPVKDDSEREDLLLAINDCKDRASLAKLWNENSKLQTTDWFRTAFTIKGKEFSK